MSTTFRCPCGWQGLEEYMESELVDAGSRYQPPEYTNRCPDCGRDWEEFEEAPVCRTCEDVIVQHEGDRCEVCNQEALEMMCDAMAEEGVR